MHSTELWPLHPQAHVHTPTVLQEWHAGGCHVNQAVNQDGHKCHPNTVDLDTGGPRDQAVTCMQSDCEVSLGWVKLCLKEQSNTNSLSNVPPFKYHT